MNIHGRRGSRSGGCAKPALTPEQIAANFRVALIWREEWRIGKAAEPAQAARPQPVEPPKAKGDEAGRRAKFAKAIARLEFGRAYWDGRAP